MSHFAKVLCITFWVLSSCGMGGTQPYAKDVFSKCKRNELITKLTELKKSGKFKNPYGYPDGIKEQAPYYFYFSSDEINGTLLLSVNAGFEEKRAISLISFQKYNDGTKWSDFNNGLDEKTQEKLVDWFNNNILPSITCD